MESTLELSEASLRNLRIKIGHYKDESPQLKGRLTAIKNTDVFKELKKSVAQYLNP